MDDDDIGTLRWFGESWGAPVCDPRAHVATPVGLTCLGHPHMHEGRSEVVEPGDQGVTMPFVRHRRVDTVAYHLDCWLHEIGADRLRPTKNNEVGGPGWSVADLD
jgi:hypothetical protein